jgi:GAF domain-containing protein/DNA-binding response OmpR family regulator
MCRVLIIDDEEFSAETIKMVLEEAGEAQADYATTYQDARELVQQSLKPNKPYEVFLIDLRLGPGKDGIEFMQELRAASPDTDAIIFTGIEDHINGVRAYEAGAFRYLSKPFENRELLFLLKSLKQWRKEQREHGWQKLFTSMMEEALRKTSFSEVANLVVEYALKLGFSRAHLFWVPTQEDANPDNRMIGITCSGKGCIPDFSDSSVSSRLYPVKQWFKLNRTNLSHEVIFIRPDEFASIQKQASKMKYHWPKGEIAFLPLWGSNRHLGELMLDHGQREKALSKHELSLLNFFARQVAIVLENASLISREQRSVQETTIINQIGRQVTDRAAEETNLPELLDEVREQIGSLMDVSNFVVVLFDPESGNLNISLSYENGIRHYHSQPHDGMGIEKGLVIRESNIFWPWDVPGHLKKNNIVLTGKMPTSYIGVQLRVGKKVIGGIVVKSYDGKEEFSRRDFVLLSAVANQISGAIKLIQANETERRDSERLNVLRRVMMEMLRIGQENEDDLWITTLTIATANFGLGFNRALLFLENDEHTLLKGKNGIGTNDPQEAWQDWDRVIEKNYHLDDFLTAIQEGKLHQTSFHSLAKEITLPFNGDNNAFMQVIKDGRRVIVDEDQINTKLPAQVRNKITPSRCAILPILTGDRSIGLVMVDNKHNSSPFSEKMLDHLQTLLNYTGLVRETLRQQSKSESLLDANYQIMGKARLQPLKETLRNICKTAQEFTEADWVLIYPLKEGKKYEFDRENATFIGNLKSLENVIKEKPSSNGTSAHILKHGKLVIPNVDNQDVVIGDAHISEHEFIKREQVKAMLGIAITDAQEEEPLGILYLDYRTPQDFSELEEHHAKSFASLAAVAISNARRFDEQRQRQRLDAALQTADATGTELNMEKMLKRVLRRLSRYLDQTTICVMTYDEDEDALTFAPATLNFYKIENHQFHKNFIYPLDGKSIACRVARKAKRTRRVEFDNIPDVKNDKDYLDLVFRTNSELCISLMSSERELLGVLVLERTRKQGFDNDDVALIKTVARQLSMAIERSKQSEELGFRSTVAAAYAWAADIAHDINREVGEIRKWAYLIKEKSGNPKISEYAEKIEASASILSMAGGPWTNPEDETLSLDEAVVQHVEKTARQRGIRTELDLGCNGIFVKINPIGFRRVISQLVRNADQAMGKLPEKKIAIRTRPLDSTWVEIQFQDFGPGISDEIRTSIFQRQITTKGQGGFGLLLTRQMIENMGGKIRLFSSDSENGTIFSIKLPKVKST